MMMISDTKSWQGDDVFVAAGRPDAVADTPAEVRFWTKESKPGLHEGLVEPKENVWLQHKK